MTLKNNLKKAVTKKSLSLMTAVMVGVTALCSGCSETTEQKEKRIRQENVIYNNKIQELREAISPFLSKEEQKSISDRDMLFIVSQLGKHAQKCAEGLSAVSYVLPKHTLSEVFKLNPDLKTSFINVNEEGILGKRVESFDCGGAGRSSRLYDMDERYESSQEHAQKIKALSSKLFEGILNDLSSSTATNAKAKLDVLAKSCKNATESVFNDDKFTKIYQKKSTQR